MKIGNQPKVNLLIRLRIPRFLLLFASISIIGHLAIAQDEGKEDEQMPFILKKDSSALGEVNLTKFRITPFIAPSVSPEVGFMLMGGGLVSFKLDTENKFVQPSSIPFSFGFSTNGSALLNLRPALFFKNDKNRLMGDLWMKDMPDNYWGIGFDAAKNPSDPDSTTSYHRNWWMVNLKYTHQFKKYLFGGLLFDFNQTKATELNPEMQQDPNVDLYGPLIQNWSLGLLFQYDSRDLTINAYKGTFFEISYNAYKSKGFEKPTYQVVVLDYRKYQQIKRPGRTLALQVKSRIGIGEVPWTEMSMIGTPFDLRGYRQGRYRDKTMMLGVLEYRHMLMRKTPRKDGNMMSRFGFVSWLATGSVGNNFTELDHWLPNAGVGLRFEVQSRMNARIDFGIGNDTNAFYVSFNESF